MIDPCPISLFDSQEEGAIGLWWECDNRDRTSLVDEELKAKDKRRGGCSLKVQREGPQRCRCTTPKTDRKEEEKGRAKCWLDDGRRSIKASPSQDYDHDDN